MKTIQTALLAAMMLGGTAWAQTPTPTDPAATPAPTPEAKAEVTTGATKLKIGGAFWANYAYDMTEGNENVNGFDVGRTYVNIEPSWGEKFYARITPDLVRETAPVVSGTSGTLTPGNTAGNLSLRLKYAYLVYVPVKDLTLKVGMQQTAYTEFEESVWGYRFIAPTAADAFYQMSSSDFGWSAGYRMMDGRLEMVGGVYNGETYQRPEPNKYKEVQARATYQVLPAKAGGLKVTGYYGLSNRAQHDDKTRAVLLVSYQHDVFTAAANYLYAQEGGAAAGPRKVFGGPSVFGSYKVPFAPDLGLQVMARVDIVDMDFDEDDDGRTRMIVGVGTQEVKNVRFMFDVQRIDFEDDREDATVLFAHWEAKF